MFKVFDPGDVYIRRVEVYADNYLTSASVGIGYREGLSGSLNRASGSAWKWAYGLFYNQETQYNSYKSHFYQVRNYGVSSSIVSVSPIYYGHRIKSGSLYFICNGNNIVIQDDGKGNLYDANSGSEYIKGNIFYEHGVIIFTDDASQYHNFPDFEIRFKSSHYIYEHNYICRIGAGEMNCSTNPTFVYGKDADSEHADNEVRFSNCPTFITTIGLYNQENQLLAIARLANPIYKSDVMDTTINIRIDL